MKKYFLFIVVALSAVNISISLASSPYAEKPLISVEVDNSFLAASIKKSIVPDAGLLNVPIYPGAKVINSFAGVKKTDGTFKRLPFLELVSTDSYDQVLGFFKEKLPGWKQGGFNTAVYFAEKGKVNIFKPESSHVGVHDVTKYFRENEQKDLQQIVPGAKSLIKIFYTLDMK